MRWWLAIILMGASQAAWAAAPVEPERRSAVVRAVERAGPAIVNISTERLVQRSIDPFFEFRDRFFEDAFGDFFQRHSRTFVQNSLGSGVLISADGYLLTNAHVVTRARKITVTFQDKSQYEATLVNIDPDHDIGLLKIKPKQPLTPAPIGTSEDLMIGETVIAIGNPFGLQNSVTTGVVSATGRSIRSNGREAFSGLLQTDAAINPGNSGGALLNIRGELIAINTAIQAGAEGIGFAIPIDTAMDSAADLLDYTRLKRIVLGLEVEPRPGGLWTKAVEPKSPAAQAGIRPGDRILSVNNQKVGTPFCLQRLLFERRPGDQVAFGLERDGRPVNARVTLGLLPEPSPRELAKAKLGLDVQPMTQELAEAMGLREESGVLIARVEPKGPGARAGLQASDLIVYVGRRRIETVNALARLLKDLKARTEVPLLIVRNRRLYRTALTIR
jgi:serine protease Do